MVAQPSPESDETRWSLARPLRVLWVSPRPEYQASMIFVERQIESLLAAGIEGRTFHLQSRTSPLVVLRELKRLQAAIADFQPDVVHAQYGTMTALVTALATTRPFVVTFRGSDLNPAPEKSWLRCVVSRWASQIAACRATRIIAVSEALVCRLWCNAARATIIPSGIDTAVFHPLSRDEARASCGWGPEEQIVLFNGSHRPLKRPDLARAAVEFARGDLGTIRLVELDGRQPPEQMPLLMNAADCLILTSDHEGSPNVVKEAIACGLPVVSRAVGDVRQRLAGVHPSRVAGDSPEELGGALLEVLRAKSRSNGPDLAHAFSLEAVATRILAIYRTAATA